MARDPRAYLYDALQRTQRIQMLLTGRTLDDYLADEGLRESVQWNLAILGEALAALRKIAPDVAGRVSDLPGSVSLRNFLIHVYHAIDDEKVWDTTVRDLPAIIGQIEVLLGELDETES